MKLSEFQIAVDEEFGPGYGSVVVNDLVLAAVGERTARDALAAGVPPREVWLALCEATDVPARAPTRRGAPGARSPWSWRALTRRAPSPWAGSARSARRRVRHAGVSSNMRSDRG
ncbi:DUF3046 domain-containing protein [Agromyces bauzanensis]